MCNSSMCHSYCSTLATSTHVCWIINAFFILTNKIFLKVQCFSSQIFVIWFLFCENFNISEYNIINVEATNFQGGCVLYLQTRYLHISCALWFILWFPNLFDPSTSGPWLIGCLLTSGPWLIGCLLALSYRGIVGTPSRYGDWRIKSWLNV
jgi:hypothetical protein